MWSVQYPLTTFKSGFHFWSRSNLICRAFCLILDSIQKCHVLNVFFFSGMSWMRRCFLHAACWNPTSTTPRLYLVKIWYVLSVSKPSVHKNNICDSRLVKYFVKSSMPFTVFISQQSCQTSDTKQMRVLDVSSSSASLHLKQEGYWLLCG